MASEKDAKRAKPTRRSADERSQVRKAPATRRKKVPSGNGKPSGRRRAWPLALVAMVFLLIIAGTALFCWQKWWGADDYEDIKGVWKVEATGDTVVFDAHNLKLTTSISYEYRLDTQAKTIAYSFGTLEGGGRYYFDTERERLLIVEDGQDLGLLANMGFLPEDVLAADTADDAITVLAKVSSDTAAQPSGRGSGLAGANASHGEREYVVAPDPEPSSSSSSKRAKSSSASASASASASREDE